MRTLKYLFILTLSLSHLQAEVGWSPPVTLGEGIDVDLDVDANGNGIAVWAETQQTSGPIQSRKFDIGTKTWSAPLLVNNPGGDGPRIAINPFDGNAVTIWLGSNSYLGAFLPFGASTWTQTTSVFPNLSPVFPPDLIYQGVPVAAVRNQTNNIVGSVLNLNNLTWSPTNDIASPAGDPQLDAGTGALVMVWSVVNGPILYSRSLVFPPVWSSPGQLVNVTAATGTNPSLSVNNNTAVVIWESDITSSIKSALLSPLNAPNWTPIADLPPGDTPKVAGENGRFVAVWVDSTDNRVHGAILNNTVWTSITPLSTPGQTVENPQVAVDLAGNAYAIWANTTTQTIQGANLATGSTTWIATNDLSPAGGSNPKIKSLLPGNALAVWQLTSNTPDAVPFMQVQASFFPFELQPPVSPISPPSNFSGSVLKNRFATQTDIIHVLTWNPSPDPAVEGYRLFENGVLVATIPASGPFTFTLHNRCRGQIYSYTLVAFNASSVSSPLTLILP